jgi:hypothetical protein
MLNFDGFRNHFLIDFATFSQFAQCCYNHVRSINFEVVTQVFTAVRATKPSVPSTRHQAVYVSTLCSANSFISQWMRRWSVVHHLSDVRRAAVSSGCSMFQRSQSWPSRASSVKEVTRRTVRVVFRQGSALLHGRDAG